MIPGSSNPLMMAAAPAAGAVQIERSLRFNSSDSAYLSRTPGTAGNRRTWTWAGWVKRSDVSGAVDQHLWGVAGTTNATYGELWFDTANKLNFDVGYSTAYGIITTRVFRDPGAWFHIVLAFDATQATAANKIKLYINGVEETLFSADTRSALTNQDWGYNNTATHYIGCHPNIIARFFNGYLADIHFIDGQALTPSSFTEVSATTGQLIPKAYAGTYTGNSFWLKFNDNSAATATTLGKDSFLLGNNWTPNNLSVTAGAGNDSLVDTPTSYGTDTSGVGGVVRGNYCTLNPLISGTGTLSNGNLDFTTAIPNNIWAYGTIKIVSGKWYWEVSPTSNSVNTGIGIDSSVSFANYFYILGNGKKRSVAGGDQTYGSAIAVNDVIGVALDADANTLTFYINGVSQGIAFSGLTDDYFPLIVLDSYGPGNIAYTANFGQRPFAYQTPGTNRPAATFLALCDTNLGAPLVALPNTLMDVKLYTGTGSSQTITGLNFSPDLVWLKRRDFADSHQLFDIVRGATKFLGSDTTNAELTLATLLTSFDSSGFSIGSYYASSTTWVAWAWDAGTSTVSNTQGSITSQVRANVSAGFSIVTYTGNGTYPSTVGHGLGVAPHMIILKIRNQTRNWFVYHKAAGTGAFEGLNTTAAYSSYSPMDGSAVTSTTFKVVDTNSNANNDTLVAYCFAPVVGYSSFGSYTGNGLADGPFVYTGFRPRWLLIKSVNYADTWVLIDAAREIYNVMNTQLRPNSSNAENVAVNDAFDFLSNGFKIRGVGSVVNTSAAPFIYAAFAENPFQYARAR